MSSAQGVELTLPAHPESLALVRQAAAGVADVIGLPPPKVADLKTVVTEACMNAIVHAYPDAEGPLKVWLNPDEDALEVVIRDFGVGFHPRPIEPGEQTLRLGLPLIATLTDEFEIRGGPTRGTEVRLRIGWDAAQPPPTRSPPEVAERTTAVAVAPGELARPVLSRLIAAAASRADLSIDLLSNGILVGDVISAERASQFVHGIVGVQIEDIDGSVSLRVGPLVEGGAERIVRRLEVPGGPGTSGRKLVPDVRTSREAEGEYVAIEISEGAPD